MNKTAKKCYTPFKPFHLIIYRFIVLTAATCFADALITNSRKITCIDEILETDNKHGRALGRDDATLDFGLKRN